MLALVESMETHLMDFSDVPFEQVRLQNSDELEPYLQTLFSQVKRPRANQGGSGPPGRAD